MPFGTVEDAVRDIRNGRFVVVADDEDRENEGDLICAAELVTPEMVNFMMEQKGMICVALDSARVAHLGLAMQSDGNTEEMRTAFTVSIDAAREVRGHHRDQCRRSRGDDPGRGRSRQGACRPPPAGTRASAPGA